MDRMICKSAFALATFALVSASAQAASALADQDGRGSRIALTSARLDSARLNSARVNSTRLENARFASANSGGDCCTPAPPCCPPPCITYRHHGLHRVCCGCPAPISTVLHVTNPCTGCATDVPVCVPGCCTSAPKVCCATSIIGRNVMWYDWCCGYSVKVAFKACGDIIVTSYGR